MDLAFQIYSLIFNLKYIKYQDIFVITMIIQTNYNPQIIFIIILCQAYFIISI